MSSLAEYIGKPVLVITHDGRTLVGKLEGFDQMINIILSECVERIFSEDEGVEEVERGLYVVRGDNVAVIGENDLAVDKTIDYATVTAPPIKEVVY